MHILRSVGWETDGIRHLRTLVAGVCGFPPVTLCFWVLHDALNMSPSKLRRDLHRARAHNNRRLALQCCAGRRPTTSARARSPSSRRLARARRASWLDWRADRHADVPQDRVWLLDRLRRAAFHNTGRFGHFVAGFAPGPRSGRQRDVFPLAPVTGLEHKPAGMLVGRWRVLMSFVNVIVAALNWLYGVKQGARAPAKHTACQRAVVANVVARANSVLVRLQTVEDGSWERFLPDFVARPLRPAAVASSFQDLVADRVDNLEAAALCDPLPHLPPDVQSKLCGESEIVAATAENLDCFEAVPHGSREEYAKLVVKQLRCGKLGLSTWCKAGGTTFAVGKPGGSRLREVWDGRRVSEASARPPKPRHLASPTALTFLECTQEHPLRLSKRDASCWFDQLKLPQSLRMYMAKPALSAAELCKAGMPVHEQQHHLEAGQTWCEGPLFPLHHVWPMGFSWSSYVAQEEMLSVCEEAGIPQSALMACDQETPTAFELVAAVATDDVMIFSNAGPGATSKAARNFDASMEARGAVRNSAKDVNDELCGTCVGVDLDNGCFLDVPGARFMAMILAFLHLHACRVASPKDVQQLLGAFQWFDLLVRPKLSVYSSIYKFTLPGDGHAALLPAEVVAELACSLCLGVFWRCDLRRPFLPLVGATDASTSYGFGASCIRATSSVARKLARVAEKQGAFVVMDGGAAETLGGDRLTKAHQLNMKLEHFSDIFSVRCKFPAHINVLEGEAFVLFLRWLLRTKSHHSARVVVLLDSAVLLGAAAKGRSSSQLNRLLRKVAALTLAGSLQAHLIFVPSSENPADSPSRGMRRRRVHGEARDL